MASEQPAAAGSPPPAQVVGNAFVHQYYHVLHHSPQLVFRFYHEISTLGRPDRQGDMTSVTGMEAINEKILSLEYSEFRAVIKTVDAQESIDGGVVVLVTGYLTGKDDVERNFIQSFFLATQDKGYYVRNDIFRYVGDDDDDQRLCDTVTSANSEPFAPEQEADSLNVDQLENEVLEEEELNEEVYDTSEDEDAPTFDKKTPEAEVSSEVPKSFEALVPDPSSSAVLDEAPKKSYASIVKVMKENPAAPQVPLPPLSKPSVANIEQQSSPTPPPAPATESSVDSNAVDSNSTQELEVDSYSIYIKNLPLNATPAQLEGEFKKFGPIKPGGIQVRSHKQQGFCFGFVEFEDATAVQSAIEASPVMVGGRQAFVEEKRPSSSRVGSRGRFLPIRGGGYRNDVVRGRSNYGGGRIYGRGDHNYSRSDFGHRGGGRGGPSNSGGGDFGYQRAYHGSSGGRGNRGGSNVSNWSSRNNAAQVPAAS